MKNLIEILEDLWVEIAFAEAGIYEPADAREFQPRYQETIRIHAA